MKLTYETVNLLRRAGDNDAQIAMAMANRDPGIEIGWTPSPGKSSGEIRSNAWPCRATSATRRRPPLSRM